MEHIPGYDQWKTRLPEEPKPSMHCNCCGNSLYEGDTVYEIDGGICEECLNDRYRKFL